MAPKLGFPPLSLIPTSIRLCLAVSRLKEIIFPLQRRFSIAPPECPPSSADACVGPAEDKNRAIVYAAPDVKSESLWLRLQYASEAVVVVVVVRN